MQELGRAFAQAVQGEPGVRELWVTTRPDGVHLWLLVEPMELDAERRLHGLTAALYGRFPDADFHLHVVNLRHFRKGLRRALPAGAEQISLR